MTIPADNRRLVESALHPDTRDAIAAELGVAWQNHAAARAGSTHAERGTAQDLSLDLSAPFRELSFPDDGDVVTTRLGAHDLLIDLELPLDGPFGRAVDRLTIPSWMARGVTPNDRPTPAIRDTEGWRFRLGERSFVYGRWGLGSSR